MKTIQQTYSSTHYGTAKPNLIFNKFLTWCKSQEKYRFGWVAAIIAGHGCVITPITVLLVTIAGNSPLAWGFSIAAMAMALVSNLAAMPTKITIPVFFLSVLIDIAIIANCIFFLAMRA